MDVWAFLRSQERSSAGRRHLVMTLTPAKPVFFNHCMHLVWTTPRRLHKRHEGTRPFQDKSLVKGLIAPAAKNEVALYLRQAVGKVSNEREKRHASFYMRVIAYAHDCCDS